MTKAKQTDKVQLSEQEVLPMVANTITEKPLELYVDVKPRSKIEAWLIRHKLRPSRYYFQVKPQRVINVYRIAGRVKKLNVDGIFNTTDTLSSLMNFMANNGEDIFYIVAAAIQNDDREPTERMLNIVKNNFEMQDIHEVMKIAVNGYNIDAFINSIVLMTGVQALNLKTSPKENGG